MDTETNHVTLADHELLLGAWSRLDRDHGYELDRRRQPRFEIDAPATLLLVGNGSTIQGRVTDLSQEGCRLRARQRFAAGVQVRVEVSFRVNGLTFRLGGVTQWNNGWNLMGVRFTNMQAWRAADLAEVIGEVRAEYLVRAAKLAEAEGAARIRDAEALAETASSEQLTETGPQPEPGAKEAEFRAAIHAVPDQAESRQANHPGDRRGKDGVEGLERRAQPRHMVDTFASIVLVQSGSRLSGWILDLSLEGCRIRTDARFPAGIYTRVEAEFCVEGLPFRLAGVVQSIYDRKLVGIQFIKVSERKNAQLEQLIAEIKTRDTRGKPAMLLHPLAGDVPGKRGFVNYPLP